MAKELTGIEALKYRFTSQEVLNFIEENRIRIRRLEKAAGSLPRKGK